MHTYIFLIYSIDFFHSAAPDFVEKFAAGKTRVDVLSYTREEKWDQPELSCKNGHISHWKMAKLLLLVCTYRLHPFYDFSRAIFSPFLGFNWKVFQSQKIAVVHHHKSIRHPCSTYECKGYYKSVKQDSNYHFATTHILGNTCFLNDEGVYSLIVSFGGSVPG